MLSDVQPEKIEGGDTAGLFAFNKTKMPGMIDAWVSKSCKVADITRRDHPIGRLVFFLLGDYVPGEAIYPGQSWHLDMDLLEQLTWLPYLFARGILEIAKHIAPPQGVDIFALRGNHGRLGKRGEIQCNADDLFIKFLECQLRESKDIRIYHSASDIMGLQLFERWNFVLTHGSETRGYVGVPWYGLTRDTLKQMALLQQQVHYKLTGHHHQSSTSDIAPNLTVMMNGSWMGGTDFSVNVVKGANIPTQWAFGLHPEVGRTNLYDLKLGEVRRPEPDKRGIMTPLIAPVRFATED
jgi:hypothetical protein